MTPRPPDTPPARSAFACSPRALAWLKRQLYLLLVRKSPLCTDVELEILAALALDPDVESFFKARAEADQPP